MAKQAKKQTINRLSARGAEALSKPGRHADGGGLYLSVGADGRKRWTFLYRRGEKLREMGLGSAHKGHTSLAEAREKAGAARRQLRDGIDPLTVRRAAQAIPLFGEFADALVEEIAPGFKNSKHIDQWKMTFETYCAAIRDVRVNQVNTEHVLTVLRPLWADRIESGSRVRGRIERVLSAAKARGLREGENPARWRGHLDQMLPKRQKLKRGRHKAMPYDDVPAFMADLREREAPAARALEFLILTATRGIEGRGALWGEFDLDGRMWVIPPARMKGGREHRVPLSKRAVEVLKAIGPGKSDELVFPGPEGKRKKKKGPQPFSESAFKEVLARMDVENATPHGFRSSFKDWSVERTGFPNIVSEAALAHKIKDEAEAAYRRGDLFEKRRKLMEAWAGYCAEPKTGKVVSINSERAAS